MYIANLTLIIILMVREVHDDISCQNHSYKPYFYLCELSKSNSEFEEKNHTFASIVTFRRKTIVPLHYLINKNHLKVDIWTKQTQQHIHSELRVTSLYTFPQLLRLVWTCFEGIAESKTAFKTMATRELNHRYVHLHSLSVIEWTGCRGRNGTSIKIGMITKQSE